MSNTSENDLNPVIENLKEGFNNCITDINYIKRGINIMTEEDYAHENIKDIRFKGDVTVAKGEDNVTEIQISGGGGADLQDIVISNRRDISNVGRLTCDNIGYSHAPIATLDVINCGIRILHPDTTEGLVINPNENMVVLQEKRIRSHHIENLNNNLVHTAHKYSEGRVSSFNQVSDALVVDASVDSGIYYDIVGDYFQLRRNDATQYAVYKEFEKIASETDHLDSVYMAVDISGFPENGGGSDICEIFFGQQSTRGSESGTLVADTSFEITKPITKNGRHTFHSNFPDNISNIGTQVYSSVLRLGIRMIADHPTVVIKITGAYIETELKFGEGIRGVSFSPEGGALVPDRTNPITDGHQYPYHEHPDRTTDAIKKAYESGFNLCKTYNMPSSSGTATADIGTSITSTDVNSPGLLLQIKNFNDSLPLNQQHRRIRLSLGMEHNVYTDAQAGAAPANGTLPQTFTPVNRNRMLEVAYEAIRDYDFIHSIYLGNERVSPYSNNSLSFYSYADEFKNSWPTNVVDPITTRDPIQSVWNKGDAIRAAIITYLRPMIQHFRDTYCTTFPHNGGTTNTGVTFGQHGKRCVLSYGFSSPAVYQQDYIKELYGASVGHHQNPAQPFDSNKDIGLDFISANLYGGYHDNNTNTLYDPVTYMGDGKPGGNTGRGTTGIMDDLQHMQYHFSQHGPFKNKIVISELGFQNNNKQGSGRKVGNQEWQQRFFDIFSRFMYTNTYKGVTFSHHFLYGSWFVLTDESWKGEDNYWGIFSEGDSNSIGHRRIITDNWFINKSDNFVKIPFVDTDGNALTPNTTYEITTGPATSINNISFVKKTIFQASFPPFDLEVTNITNSPYILGNNYGTNSSVTENGNNTDSRELLPWTVQYDIGPSAQGNTNGSLIFTCRRSGYYKINVDGTVRDRLVTVPTNYHHLKVFLHRVGETETQIEHSRGGEEGPHTYGADGGSGFTYQPLGMNFIYLLQLGDTLDIRLESPLRTGTLTGDQFFLNTGNIKINVVSL